MPDKTYALTTVYGEGECLTVALDIEFAHAIEQLLREHEGTGELDVRYNPWTRLSVLLIEGGIYFGIPITVDGRPTSYGTVLHFGHGSVDTLRDLPLSPIAGLSTDDGVSTLGAAMKGRTAANEEAMRMIPLDAMPNTPETIWLHGPNGWYTASGNTMLGVWLVRKDEGPWGIITPIGTGAILPETDLLEKYKRTQS